MRFFTSDLHFGHLNVIKYCKRPFEHTPEGLEKMNEMLVHNWNAVVRSDDEVIIIGDFSLSVPAAQKYANRLAGKKRLVLGNHEVIHPANKKSRKPDKLSENRKAYEDMGFELLGLQVFLPLKSGITARLYHLPYKEDCVEGGAPQNHPTYRLEDDGVLLLCGHVHDLWKTRFTVEKLTPMINVGVDVWDLAPVSEDELCKAFQTMNPER